MTPYQLFLIPKFCGVLLFMAGIGGALLAPQLVQRKLAVHRVASLGLLLTWVFGYLAVTSVSIPVMRPWIAGSLLLSFVTQSVLVYSVNGKGHRSIVVTLAATIPMLLIVVLMVARPQ